MPYFIGIVLALSTTFGGRIIGMDRDRAFYAVILAVVASYYVLFAATAGASGVAVIETGIAVLYLAAMIAGFRKNLWWLVAGLAAHGLMDAVHGQVVNNPGVPAWWPAFCGSFDITAAAVLGGMLSVRVRRESLLTAAAPSRKPLAVAIAAVVVMAFGAQPMVAQVDAPYRARTSASLAVVQTRPVGVLGSNIGLGYGITGSLLVPLDRRGMLSFRAEIGAAQYGSDSKRTLFSESVGGRVEVKVRTVNAIVPASLGLQLTLPTGPVLTYLTTGVGGQAFYTESSVEPTSGGSTLASTINQSDVAATWTVGGGFYVPLRAASRVSLDVGAQYIGGGRAQYLARGSIVDLPNGQIAITPMESSTHLVVVRFGARLGL